jgi:hypothetical protein
MQHLTVIVVNNVQCAEAPSVSKAVVHKVHTPHLVGRVWLCQRLFDTCGQAFLGLRRRLKAQLFVDAVLTLVVPAMATAPQAIVALSEAYGRMPGDQMGQSVEVGGIVNGAVWVALGAARQVFVFTRRLSALWQ